MGCLLADIRMSGIDGLSLQKKLNMLGCLIPVIIISGHGDVSMARAAFKANAIDFLEKPLDYDRLIAAIDEVFSREEKTATGPAQDPQQRLADPTDAARMRGHAACRHGAA
jgi:FixJ family two-component response regulator